MWDDHSGRVGLRHTEALREGAQGAGRGITKGTQCDQQRGQEEVNALIGLAAAAASKPTVV